MKSLKAVEIEKLANKPGVRRIAVENFLGTMGTSAAAARGNLYMDARLYKWNGPTVHAILAGIKLAERL